MVYDKEYFEWQKNVGILGGRLNLFKFEPFIQPDDTVVDFGCGGGYLLKNINCTQKYGIEINDIAREEAAQHGITAYKEINQLEDASATVVISNHALEHVENPVDILRQLKAKMAPDAQAVFVVPHQKMNEPFTETDINKHLYTWNPLTLGNLFQTAGFKIDSCDAIRHKWPRRYQARYDRYGNKLFHLICRANAILKGESQVRVIASNPSK